LERLKLAEDARAALAKADENAALSSQSAALAARVAALEAEVAASAAAAGAARAALAEAEAASDAFEAKARRMLEEKDEELEEARMTNARTHAEGVRDDGDESRSGIRASFVTVRRSTTEETEGIGTNAGESDPSQTPREHVATGAAVADASAASSGEDAKETAAEVAVAPPSLSAETAESSRLDYLRNVIAKFLVTDDWETQDRLVPVIGAVLGFSETELAAVKTKRDALTPLDIRAARLIG
jgi:hypothetical protein